MTKWLLILVLTQSGDHTMVKVELEGHTKKSCEQIGQEWKDTHSKAWSKCLNIGRR